MENLKVIGEISAEELREHFDAIEEAARLRRLLDEAKRREVSLAQEIARRESELDVPIEIIHSEFDRHGEIVYGGAIIGR